MASHDPEMGMLFQDVVPRLDLLPVARNFTMQKSVVLGMLFVVAGGICDHHRLRGKPAISRFSNVRHQGLVLAFDVVQQGIEPGVVDHDPVPVRIFEHHADLLPNLDGHGAVTEALLNRFPRGLSPIRMPPVLQVERSGPGDLLGPAPLERFSDGYSSLQVPPVGPDHADIQPLHVVLLQEIEEQLFVGDAVFGNVGVGVDLGHALQCFQGRLAVG